MHVLMAFGVAMLIILAVALRPQSPVKKYALGCIASLIIGLLLSYALLMAQAFGPCLVAFFGTLLVAAWFWSRMWSLPPDYR